ncbi:TPA: succinylglutamate desuccinylase/aspartoacylase family protein [Photobacterium damselae]
MAQTIYTGDTLQSIPVISHLNVSDLPVGCHQFWFSAYSNALAQNNLLPVWVFKGAKEGKRLCITAGVHGDEFNGILAAQQCIRELQENIENIQGTVVVVPIVNLSGVLHHHRDFFSSDLDLSSINLNRYFPGNKNGNAAEQYLAAIWFHLLHPNADLAIDLHTQTSGTCYPLYVFADYRLSDAVTMARLIEPDVILDDPGAEGVLETVWNQHQIPSITIEVGCGRITELEFIERAVNGIWRVLEQYNIAVTEEREEPIRAALIEGKEVTSIRALIGGFIIPQVTLLEKVEAEQLVAIQYDIFGQEAHRYYAPKEGIVLSFNIESLREVGSLVVRLIH